ncbi:MAG: flagellar FlbD family protein [Clostridia bacterium]|nr:flagellar FlbD family protein [Clostridia bacterium]
MIEVTSLNGRKLIINADLIESLESVPETVITLTNGKKLLVVEPPDEIVERITLYRRRLIRATRVVRGVK